MEMKASSKDFRVRKAAKVDLQKWPTQVYPVYESTKHYKKLLESGISRRLRDGIACFGKRFFLQ
jgi:hypothetical protein